MPQTIADFMCSVIDDQLNGVHPEGDYILEGFGQGELATIKCFIYSFPALNQPMKEEWE